MAQECSRRPHAMGNKLIHVARRMKVSARDKGSREQVRLNHSLNAATIEAYSELADNIRGRKHITPEQRRRM